MILIDSSVWIDYFKGRQSSETDLLDRLLPRESLIVVDLILAEVLQGFRSDIDFQRTRRRFEAFEYRAIAGREIAIAAAQNYRALRVRGLTVRSTIDTLIATFCIVNGLELLHSDRDFDPFERHLGLRVVRV